MSIDWNKKWVCVRADIRWVKGVELRPITPGQSGAKTAMVLMKPGWSKMYFLPVQPDWDEDRYFEQAESLMAQRGIREPREAS